MQCEEGHRRRRILVWGDTIYLVRAGGLTSPDHAAKGWTRRGRGTYGAEREVEKDDGVACATRSICGRGRVGAAVLSREVAVVPVCGIVVLPTRGVRF